MKKVAAYFSLLSLLALQCLAFDAPSFRSRKLQNIQPGQGLNQTGHDRRRANFEKARNLLIEKNVPFDPELLLTPHWRKTLRTTFDQMPELNQVRRGTDRLKGVQIAHTLYLPEKVRLEGDTVILVRNLIFEGHEAVIRGPFNIYAYPIAETGVLGTSFEVALREHGAQLMKVSWTSNRGLPVMPVIRGGTIRIDTSGLGRADWLQNQQALSSGRVNITKVRFQQGDNKNGSYGGNGGEGTEGAQGTTGSTGTPGSNGSCGSTSSVNGANGQIGATGGTGGTGTTGGNGGNGGPAGVIDGVLKITPPAITFLPLGEAMAVTAERAGRAARVAPGELAAPEETGRIAHAIKEAQAVVEMAVPGESAIKAEPVAPAVPVATAATVAT